MPELPEVTTIINGLRPKLIGLKINNIEYYDFGNLSIKPLSRSKFNTKIINNIIEDIARRGKFIIFKFLNNIYGIVHLKMTGQLIWQTDQLNTPRYARLRFDFNSGFLYLCDKSKWCRFQIWNKDLSAHPSLNKIGIDALDLTFKLLKQMLSKRNIKIHPFLLDQSEVAGLGNIYANEVLFKSSIHPARLTRSLKDSEIKKLVYFIKRILNKAIKYKGTTFSDYRDADGNKGQMQNYLKVFKRKDKPCFACGNLIKRDKINSRGVFYCAKCQN